MLYEMRKKGDYNSVGIDKVRDEYVFENLEGICYAPTYYAITKEDYELFPYWPRNKLYEVLNRGCLCSHYLPGQSEKQLCRLYEKKIDGSCVVLKIGKSTL